jgi:hypothetical protein
VGHPLDGRRVPPIDESLDKEVCGPGRHLAPYALHRALKRVRDADTGQGGQPAAGIFRADDLRRELLAEAGEVVER